MDGWIISKEDDDLVENLDVLDENTFEYLIKKKNISEYRYFFCNNG